MTNTVITVAETLKSRANFEELVLNSPMPQDVCRILNEYPQKGVERIADLTQNFDTLLNKVSDIGFNVIQTPYLVWFVTNEKEKIMRALNVINRGDTALKIFVFKAYSLNDDEIGFECLLKPELKEKTKRTVNTETPAKQLQKAYWEVYFTECDEEQSEMQVTPYPRHYQNISIGKAGIQILQTINTQNNYVASELAINNNKEIFNTLFEHKDEIEKEVGELEWDSKETNKSAKIRKVFPIDINNPKNHLTAGKEHIKMAEELKAIAKKYIK
ncbi:DUF4268 domain-containing protein [bacterium]|nr:DUF4268 domain-containing protein [bacterium]MBR1681218.1 DUF4268 domain-containing protein [bacterium]